MTTVTTPAPSATNVSQYAARSASACARDREVCACPTSRMIFASAVCSPVPVTSTRSEPEPFTVPAMTRSPGFLSTGRDSPVIIDSLTALVPTRTTPSAGMPWPGSDEHEIAVPQLRERHVLQLVALDTRRRIGQELRELLERALRLGDRPHLEPVPEQHDGDERRQLLPQRHARIAERHDHAEDERDGDRQRDERHHPGQAIAELSHRALDEDPSAVDEDRGAEDGRNPVRTREGRRRISAGVLEHVAPDERGDRQQQRDPELVSKCRGAVASMRVVRRGPRMGRDRMPAPVISSGLWSEQGVM